MIAPKKCINCIHHIMTKDGADYCNYIEYFNEFGAPVPYPYFYKQDYPCKGHKEGHEEG